MARFDKGWVKLWRGSTDSDLFDNDTLWKLWTWLLVSASWKPSTILWKGERRDLAPGTVVMGITELASSWGCSKSKISRWLKYLEKTERIRNESGTEGTLVTVCNWETYQATEYEGGTETEQKENATGTRAEPYKESKKVRREEGRGDSAIAPPTLARIWNENSGSLPKVRECGATRRRKAEARWREKPDEAYWVEVITKIRESKFCTGGNDRGWVADFDFLIGPETQYKVMEGKYSDRDGGSHIDWDRVFNRSAS